MSMSVWNVYLNDVCIDTVFFIPSCTSQYVRDALINHDGYDSAIIVKLSK